MKEHYLSFSATMVEGTIELLEEAEQQHDQVPTAVVQRLGAAAKRLVDTVRKLQDKQE